MLTGATPVAFFGIGNYIGHLQSGTLKGIAIDADKRSPLFPDLPTLAETGAGVREYSPDWFGLFAPAGTPADIIEKLNAEVQKLGADKEFQEKVLAPYMMTPIASSTGDFATFIRSEAAMWKAIIEQANLHID